MKKIFILLLVSAIAAAAEAPVLPKGKVVAQFDFEGPFLKHGKNDRIQKDFTNNYQWGKKEILFSSDRGIRGNAQKIDIRGISSGELQFFSPSWGLWRGKYYRVSFFAKGEGFESKVSVRVRKIAYPWTVYMEGISFLPTEEWKKYSFWAEAKHDIDNGFGVLFSTGSLGRLWIDDITVEQFDVPPEQKIVNRNPVVKGNLLPRSSYEGTEDFFWTNGIYTNRACSWYGDWLDPRIYRAENGKFGKSCMGIPVPARSGDVFVSSYRIPVAAGERYTFSVWLRTDGKDRRIRLNVDKLGDLGATVTKQWKRFSLTTRPVPADCTETTVRLFQRAADDDYTIYADGFQFEHGIRATEYKPAYPYEITVKLAGSRTGIIPWQQAFPVEIHTASAAGSDNGKAIPATLRITGYPDRRVLDRGITLESGKVQTWTVDPKRNGLFRIEVIPLDARLAAPAEKIAGRLPVPRKTGAESMFGSHISVRPYFLEYAKAIGIKWNRLHDASGIAKWGNVEPVKGKVQWADEQVDAMIRAGFHILGLPDYPPEWARSKNPSEPYVDPQAYREHCRRVAEHYKGRIDYWEIWNEPYINYFFPRPVSEFGTVFEAGAKGIREGNPEAKILGFCTEINGTGYASGIPPEIRKYPDIISFHCYFQNLTGGGTSSYRKEIDAYRKFMGKDGPKEYWNTEGAYSAVGSNSFYSFLCDPEMNERAVAFCARVWQEQRKGGISKVFIYTMHQSDTVAHTGGYKKLIGFDRSLTPAAASTALTAWCIDGLNPLETKPIRGVVQSLFSDGKRHTWSCFNDSGIPGTGFLDLTKIPTDFMILDPMGNDPRRDGMKRWKIGRVPLFIMTDRGSAAALAETARNAISR